MRNGIIRVIANEPNERDQREYVAKESEERDHSHIPAGDPVIFLEVTVTDPSEFAPVLQVRGEERYGYRVLRVQSASVPNAIAAVLLWVRDDMGAIPHVYFAWTEGHPVMHALRFLAFGAGDIAPTVREILRQAERNPARRPGIHVS